MSCLSSGNARNCGQVGSDNRKLRCLEIHGVGCNTVIDHMRVEPAPAEIQIAERAEGIRVIGCEILNAQEHGRLGWISDIKKPNPLGPSWRLNRRQQMVD